MNACANLSGNMSSCICSYPSCDRKGFCCECLRYHLGMKQLPGCCFPKEAEKTYDRSFKQFVRIYKHLLD